MAESTSTELALSSNDFSDGAISDQSQQEQKSGFLGSMGGMDIVRQVISSQLLKRNLAQLLKNIC